MHAYIAPLLAFGGWVFIVEPRAALTAWLARNLTESPQQHKRTMWATEAYLRADVARHCCESEGALPLVLPYVRLWTDALNAANTARGTAVRCAL